MTLADFLASIAVLGVLMGGLLGSLVQGQRAYAVGAARVDAQQSARAALARLAAEIRTAGDGSGGFDAISLAGEQRLVLHRDVNGNGVIAGRGETIMWRLSGTTLRRDAGGGAQPVADGVETFRLTYFDAAGAPTSSAAAVRSVSITLSTRPQHAGTLDRRGVAATLSTHVRLRNR